MVATPLWMWLQMKWKEGTLRHQFPCLGISGGTADLIGKTGVFVFFCVILPQFITYLGTSEIITSLSSFRKRFSCLSSILSGTTFYGVRLWLSGKVLAKSAYSPGFHPQHWKNKCKEKKPTLPCVCVCVCFSVCIDMCMGTWRPEVHISYIPQ